MGALLLTGMLACAPPPPPGRIYAVRRPPRVRVEAIGLAPGRGYVWIGGFWRWDRSDFLWVGGHWMLPPAGYRVWVPGRWVRDRRHGWYWVEGRWRR